MVFKKMQEEPAASSAAGVETPMQNITLLAGHDLESGADDRLCRICLDNSPEGMLAPCMCRGSQKWVHRSCLDRWRYTRSGNSFTHCHECQFAYRYEDREGLGERKIMKKAQLMVARDSALILIAVQVGILLFALGVFLMDEHVFDFGIRHKLFPSFLGEKHRITTYYICGCVAFFAVLGLTYVVVACCMGLCNQSSSQGAHVGVYYDDCFCCWVCCNDVGSSGSHGGGSGCDDCKCIDHKCDCHNMNCDGGDDALGAAALILIVIVLAFFVVGLVVSAMIVVAALQKAYERYTDRMRKKYLVKEYVVLDLDGKSAEEIIDLCIVEPPAQLQPSAPPAPSASTSK